MTPNRKIKCIGENGASVSFGTRYSPFLLLDADGLYGYNINVNLADSTMIDGSTYIGSLMSKRNIVLTISDRDEHWAHRGALYNVFRKGQRGTLIFYEDEIERQINYYVEKVEPGSTGHLRSTTISLICPDPYFYATAESTIEIGIFIPLFEFPFELIDDGIEFGSRSEARSVLVDLGVEGENLSAVDGIGMTLTLTTNSATVNPKITYTRGEKESVIAFDDLTLKLGDVLTISTGTGNKRVTLNGKNIINKLTSDSEFIQLHSGMNYFSFAAESGEEHLTMAATYRMKYGGV